MIHVKYVRNLLENQEEGNTIEFETHNLTVFSIFTEMMRTHPKLREDGKGIQVRVNGKILSPFKYRKSLKDGDKVLIIQDVGFEAVVAILGAGLLEGFLGITFATWGTIALLTDVALTIASTIYSYCATDKPAKTGAGLGTSPTYGWDGVQTQARPGVPVPLGYGEHAIGGNIIGGLIR